MEIYAFNISIDAYFEGSKMPSKFSYASSCAGTCPKVVSTHHTYIYSSLSKKNLKEMHSDVMISHSKWSFGHIS